MTQGEGLEFLPAFLTSLAIGLLIGIERERNPAARAGLRTFALVALFGTTTALLSDQLASPWPLVAGLVIVGLMTVAAYYREREPPADPGTTTVARRSGSGRSSRSSGTPRGTVSPARAPTPTRRGGRPAPPGG